MNCRLIAFDLDGTFLDSAKNVPEKNLEALAAAAERGIYAVPATGRIYDGIPVALRTLPFMRYYICINGAYVYDAVDDAVIHRAEVPLETALKFYEYMDDKPALYDCYQNGKGYMTRAMYERAEDYIKDPGILRLLKTLRVPVPELKAYLREKGEDVQKLQAYYADTAERDRELARLPGVFPELLFSTSVENNIEVNYRTSGKGNGLAALCRHLGIDLSDTVAFGDSSNDTDMLIAAGCGIAMANALPQVRKIADAVTLSNDECGVAEAIYKMILN